MENNNTFTIVLHREDLQLLTDAIYNAVGMYNPVGEDFVRLQFFQGYFQGLLDMEITIKRSS